MHSVCVLKHFPVLIQLYLNYLSSGRIYRAAKGGGGLFMLNDINIFYNSSCGFSVEIFWATSAVRPRADVAYCIHALARRLSKTRNWIVMPSY